MKHPYTFVLVLIVAGCTTTRSVNPDISSVIPKPYVQHPHLVFRPPAPPPLSPEMPLSTPAEIISAAQEARFDTQTYVAWPHSNPDCIRHLSVLSRAVTVSVNKMRETRNQPDDVEAARVSIKELRAYLEMTSKDSPI